MKEIFWSSLMDTEKIANLSKYSVVVVGSRLMLEILWRAGVGFLHYISDFLTPQDVLIDCSINPLEANQYDIVYPRSEESCIISYLYPEEDLELRNLIKGADLVIAHKHIFEVAKIAKELRVPFIPDIVTVFMPSGVSIEEVEYPIAERNPVSYTLLCGLQAMEVMRIFAGYKPIIAPEAIVVDLKEGLKRVWLKKTGMD
ncbi:MAG: hypothetical protein QXK59_05320 [Archaeoglobaceae archaeon]